MLDNHDQLLIHQSLAIAAVGWAVTAVLPEPGEAPYAYTVGLTELGAPELVITGLPHDIAHALLNDAADRVHEHGARWCHRQRIHDLLSGLDAVIIDGAAHELIHPGTAYARYGQQRVRLQQIVWPDPRGRFPWEDGHAHPAAIQPLLQPIRA
jgi:hypothetical protein